MPNSLSKHEKIATLLPAYNQGRLKFRRNALGLDQIQNELRKYNPDRKANDDNCIDSSKKGISRLSFYDIRHIK